MHRKGRTPAEGLRGNRRALTSGFCWTSAGTTAKGPGTLLRRKRCYKRIVPRRGLFPEGDMCLFIFLFFETRV